MLDLLLNTCGPPKTPKTPTNAADFSYPDIQAVPPRSNLPSEGIEQKSAWVAGFWRQTGQLPAISEKNEVKWYGMIRRPLSARGSAPWEGPVWENFLATFDIEDPPAQVRKRAFELARPSVPAAMCDIEDHPSTGQKMGSFSSPGHAVSLFWRLRFGKPRWSEVEVRLKAKSRCEIRPEVSPEAAKIVSFLSVPAAAFDIEDHRSTGQKTGSWARQAWVLGSLDGQKSKCISKPSPGAK